MQNLKNHNLILNSSKIKIVIIGAGKVSYSITNALLVQGFEIVSIISRNIKSAKKLASKFRIKHHSDDLLQIPPSANFFILSVPDNQIIKVAKQLASLKIYFPDCFFIHLSGTEGSDILDVLKKQRSKTGSLHIMQTFPSKKTVNIQGSYAAVESGNKNTKEVLFKLAKKLKLKPFYITSKLKTLYHLSGVYTSNFLTGNFFIAEELSGHISGVKFSDIINPIVEVTIKNISKNGAINSLSGPIERGDTDTVLKHLSELDLLIKANKNKTIYRIIKQNYIVQSLSLLELIRKRERGLMNQHSKLEVLLKAHLKLLNKTISR